MSVRLASWGAFLLPARMMDRRTRRQAGLRAPWSPLDPLISWLRKLFRGDEAQPLHTSLGRLSAHIDTAASPASTPGAPPLLNAGAVARVEEPGAGWVPLPHLPAMRSRRSSRAMKKFMAAAKQARDARQQP